MVSRKFIENSFRDGQVKTSGTDIEKILPPMRRFGGGNRAERKQTIIDKILKFFEKYIGISNFKDEDNNLEYAIENEDALSMVAEKGEDYNVI